MSAVLGVEQEMDVTDVGAMDETGFTELAEKHRRELHVHCYRMLDPPRVALPDRDQRLPRPAREAASSASWNDPSMR